MYRIGVDVGGEWRLNEPYSRLTWSYKGTNTDGVIIDLSQTHDPKTRGVVASFKHETTVNVTDGIEAAVRKVLADANVDPRGGKVLSLTIGTTVCLFALSVLLDLRSR